MSAIPRLDDEIVPFLEGNVSLLLGTRNGNLRPACTRLMGASVGADRRSITIFVPTATGARCLENIRENGHVAITFSRVLDARAYQIKGKTEGPRAPSAEELALVQRYRETFACALDEVGMPRATAVRLTCAPSVALDVAIEELYVQTPGPVAGQRLP